MIQINLLNEIPQHNQFFYKIGNALEAPAGPNHFLLHACNCKGVWGKGFAYALKQEYLQIYHENQKYCWRYGENLRGTFKEFKEKTRNVTCIYTSDGYGEQKDSRELILQNTQRAIATYFWYRRNHKNMVIHSPRINFGLFSVPWVKTAKIIKDLLPFYPNIKWVVWIPPHESANIIADAMN